VAYFLVCCVSVDGRMCITISSAVVPQGELQKAVEHMKKMLIESAGGEALSTHASARIGLKAASFAAKLRRRTERSCANLRRSSFAAATFGGAALSEGDLDKIRACAAQWCRMSDKAAVRGGKVVSRGVSGAFVGRGCSAVRWIRAWV